MPLIIGILVSDSVEDLGNDDIFVFTSDQLKTIYAEFESSLMYNYVTQIEESTERTFIIIEMISLKIRYLVIQE